MCAFVHQRCIKLKVTVKTFILLIGPNVLFSIFYTMHCVVLVLKEMSVNLMDVQTENYQYLPFFY